MQYVTPAFTKILFVFFFWNSHVPDTLYFYVLNLTTLYAQGLPIITGDI